MSDPTPERTARRTAFVDHRCARRTDWSTERRQADYDLGCDLGKWNCRNPKQWTEVAPKQWKLRAIPLPKSTAFEEGFRWGYRHQCLKWWARDIEPYWQEQKRSGAAFYDRPDWIPAEPEE